MEEGRKEGKKEIRKGRKRKRKEQEKKTKEKERRERKGKVNTALEQPSYTLAPYHYDYQKGWTIASAPEGAMDSGAELCFLEEPTPAHLK
ncbi:hypothetical protein STEG23_011306 [Scotinomys teguina]